jgi:putative endonuclease
MPLDVVVAQPSKQLSGKQAEDRVCEYITQHSLQIVARNYRSNRGEIDIIAWEGDTLVFLEVRYRTPQGYGSALESVTRTKQLRIIKTAQYFLMEKQWGAKFPCRFDVVGIEPTAEGQEIQWIRGAFQC